MTLGDRRSTCDTGSGHSTSRDVLCLHYKMEDLHSNHMSMKLHCSNRVLLSFPVTSLPVHAEDCIEEKSDTFDGARLARRIVGVDDGHYGICGIKRLQALGIAGFDGFPDTCDGRRVLTHGCLPDLS